MIQRKQTVFLLLGIIVAVICLCMPVGFFTAQGMAPESVMTNLGITATVGDTTTLTVTPLILLLPLSIVVALVTIFLYKNRRQQMRLCIFNVFIILLWYGCCAYYAFYAKDGVEGSVFRPAFAVCLPLVSLIFYVLAYRGVKADERLVRSMDRIR